MQQLAEALGADKTPYQAVPRKALSANKGVSSQSDPLTSRTLCAAIVSLQPEGAIVVDESLTSGSSYWELSQALSALTVALTHLAVTLQHTYMMQACSDVSKRDATVHDRGCECRQRLRSPI